MVDTDTGLQAGWPIGLLCTEASTGSFKANFAIAFPGIMLSLGIGTVYLSRMTTISLTNYWIKVLHSVNALSFRKSLTPLA